MKKVGLIGGTGPESTLVYYKMLNHLVCQSSGGNAFPELVIESVNLYKALNYVAEKQYQQLEEYLWQRISNLLNCGCEIIALTANTMHIVFDRLKGRLEKVSSVPFVSIPETVCNYAQKLGYRKLGLLGTIFTMQEDFFKKVFEKAGIEIVVPDADAMTVINEIISMELEAGIVKESSTSKLIENIKILQERTKMQAVVLGCTELPLALNQDNCPLPCLDIMDIHIKCLAEFCMQ